MGIGVGRSGYARLLIWPPRRDRSRRSRRAALRVDRARHGAIRRLGHAAIVRAAVVRKAGSLLLGGGHRISPASAGGMGGAFAFGIRCSRGGNRNWLARVEALRRRSGFRMESHAAGAATFFHECCRHRFRSCRYAGHAIQRIHNAGDGERRLHFSPGKALCALRRIDPQRSPQRDALPCTLFGIFLGLAVLAKGPAGDYPRGGCDWVYGR